MNGMNELEIDNPLHKMIYYHIFTLPFSKDYASELCQRIEDWLSTQFQKKMCAQDPKSNVEQLMDNAIQDLFESITNRKIR